MPGHECASRQQHGLQLVVSKTLSRALVGSHGSKYRSDAVTWVSVKASYGASRDIRAMRRAAC